MSTEILNVKKKNLKRFIAVRNLKNKTFKLKIPQKTVTYFKK